MKRYEVVRSALLDQAETGDTLFASALLAPAGAARKVTQLFCKLQLPPKPSLALLSTTNDLERSRQNLQAQLAQVAAKGGVDFAVGMDV